MFRRAPVPRPQLLPTAPITFPPFMGAARQTLQLCHKLNGVAISGDHPMLGKLFMVALTAGALMILAPAYAQRGGEGGGGGAPAAGGGGGAPAGGGGAPAAGGGGTPAGGGAAPAAGGGGGAPAGGGAAPAAGGGGAPAGGRGAGPAAAGGGGGQPAASGGSQETGRGRNANRNARDRGNVEINVGRPAIGRRYHGGVWYGERRHFWRGQWYEYGVGRCWLETPIGFVWVCG